MYTECEDNRRARNSQRLAVQDKQIFSKMAEHATKPERTSAFETLRQSSS